ncbi:unnamed protein product [Aureobasidium mustum]|uniref:Carboxylic ester hydrolase n=1 Tax=Aureobasidium mustum TaxID=2773714 RepID=A0A9N8PM21_9PEZI|nr:unnamed protein product [Aureobasidium mustum]
MYSLVFLFSIAGLVRAISGSAHTGPTARVENGLIIGTTTSLPAASATVNKFLGIPFAQSPPERFSPPRAAPHMSTINATTWKPACIQQFTYPLASQQFTELVFNNPPPQESEDCLYLNVYAPATQSDNSKGLAVMFWIYGGSLEFGNAGQPAYDGSHFAAFENVIVVSTNYRTNVFGFPSSPELPLSGHNLGFLDQRFALEWVQRNIHAFGGDPSKVTIFGESAGAFSVDALLTSFPKGSNPPFRGAILQSGQYSYRPTPRTSNIPAWYNLTAELGCPGNFGSNLSCVRAASATDIQRVIDVNSLTFSPVADNITLVSNPAQRRVLGETANIPVMGALWANASAASGIPTWRYYFNASFANTQQYPGLGVYHSSEIPIVFSTYPASNVTTQEYALSRFMRSAWATFAKNPANGPGWNAVGTGIGGAVLSTSSDGLFGGILMGSNGTVQQGDWDLGVLGDVGSVRGSGVTVLPQSTVDGRCGLFVPVYEAILQGS